MELVGVDESPGSDEEVIHRVRGKSKGDFESYIGCG